MRNFPKRCDDHYRCELVVFHERHGCETTFSTRHVPNGNSSGKRLSNSLSHDASCECRFVCTNFVAQAFADCFSSSCDQVPLSPAFLFLVCRYLKGKKFARHEEKSKIKISEWASILITKYWLVHGEIATTDTVPKQRHSRLWRTSAEHGAAVLKEIF